MSNTFAFRILSGNVVHYGVLGMKWGVRRYQNPDGSLTAAGRRHYDKLDQRWAKRNNNKVTSQVYKKARKEIAQEDRQLRRQMAVRNANGKLSLSYANAYNRIMADAMNRHVGEISSPSGRVVRFVAKRGDIGVHMALAGRDFDMSTVKSGVYSSGKIAYKKKNVDMI